MKTTDLKCNNCGSNDFDKQSLTNYRCNYCGTQVIVEAQKVHSYDPRTHHVQVNVNEIYENTRKAAKIIPFFVVGVVVVIMISTGLSVFFTFNSASEKIDKVSQTLKNQGINDGRFTTVTVNGKEIPDTLSDRKHNPSVKISPLEIMLVSERGNYQYRITGVYENGTGALIRSPRLELDFFDGDIKLQSIFPTIGRNYLLPGEKATFSSFVTLKRPYSHYVMRTPTSQFGIFKERMPVHISDVHIQPDGKPYNGQQNYIMTMRVENQSKKTVYVEVLITFMDASKKITGYYSSSISPSLAPGEKTEFDARINVTSNKEDLWHVKVYEKLDAWSIDYNTSAMD